MTWIAYKRDGKFYTKERRAYGCEPMTEVELTYEQWCKVLRTGEYTEVKPRGKKQRKVEHPPVGELQGDPESSGAETRNLEKPENED